MIGELVLIGAVLAAAASIGVYTVRAGTSPMPSLPAARRTVLAAFAALEPPLDDAGGSGPGTIYELGAGWGTLALPLARRHPGVRVVAVELSPLPWAVCALRARLAAPGNLRVLRADFLAPGAVPLSDARAVVCYLAPGIMTRLAPKLAAELPPGAVVVSSTFALAGWRPIAQHTAPDLHRSPVYVYRWPESGPGAP